MQRLRKTTGGRRDGSGNLGGRCGRFPYLAEAGKELAKKAGGAAWEGCEKLWTLTRSKLTRPEQQSVLADLETHPDNKNVQGAAIWQLEKALAADPDLARALAELLASLPAASGGQTAKRGGRQQHHRPGRSSQQRRHHALSMAVRVGGVSPQRTRSSSSASRAQPVRIT
jgi:hypothetical protein